MDKCKDLRCISMTIRTRTPGTDPGCHRWRGFKEKCQCSWAYLMLDHLFWKVDLSLRDNTQAGS